MDNLCHYEAKKNGVYSGTWCRCITNMGPKPKKINPSGKVWGPSSWGDIAIYWSQCHLSDRQRKMNFEKACTLLRRNLMARLRLSCIFWQHLLWTLFFTNSRVTVCYFGCLRAICTRLFPKKDETLWHDIVAGVPFRRILGLGQLRNQKMALRRQPLHLIVVPPRILPQIPKSVRSPWVGERYPLAWLFARPRKTKLYTVWVDVSDFKWVHFVSMHFITKDVFN